MNVFGSRSGENYTDYQIYILGNTLILGFTQIKNMMTIDIMSLSDLDEFINLCTHVLYQFQGNWYHATTLQGGGGRYNVNLDKI